ncbi:hypothetical protein L1O48_03800 [Ligilactobacillus equi]|uniref:hypothetical protein n=1 Tax=Ligilactobacillus equi TaxID=137357 RepID=UPI002ED652C2
MEFSQTAYQEFKAELEEVEALFNDSIALSHASRSVLITKLNKLRVKARAFVNSGEGGEVEKSEKIEKTVR